MNKLLSIALVFLTGWAMAQSQIDLPITWDDTANVNYTVVDFGGNASVLTADPMNANNLVLRSIKTAGAQTWAGTSLGSSLANPIPFVSGSTEIKALVYAPASGITVRMKAEDHTTPTISVETEATTTVAGWDTLTFDFANEATGTAAINFANTYDMLSIFYDFNVAGAADTFYVDDVLFASGSGGSSKAPIDLPITWDDTSNVDYSVVDFGGNASALTADPMNASNLVLRSVKTAGAQTWAGTSLGNSLANPIPFALGSTEIKALVYAPASGITVRLKAEDQTNGTISVETEATTSMAGWDTLTFDFSNQASGTAGINFANTYDKLSIFYDFNNAGAADTFYVDDVLFGAGSTGTSKAQIDLPITWDDTANVNYTVVDFGGNASMLTPDPMNASNLVLRSIKTAGAQTWAGTSLGSSLANPIPFVSGSTEIQALIYAPASGITIRLKAEDQTDPTISVETEATTTMAGWDTLTFDFANQASGTAAINFANTYDMLSIFYDFNTAGAADTFYVDDVLFGAGSTGTSKAQIDLPITWDDTTNVDYSVVDFGGNASMLTQDPMDPSNLVLRSVKTAGAQTWAGTSFGSSLANPIPFVSGSTQVQALVYAPAAGIPVRLKAEDHTDPTISVETEVMTTMAGWDTLTFDFANEASGTAPINFANTYDMLSIFYDFNTAGAADTFYVDDVLFGAGGGGGTNKLPMDLPITWDDTTNIDYTVFDFGGNASMLTEDPMDASNLVLRSVKTAGAQTWAGTSLGSSLANPIPFVSGSTIISAVVYTPAAGTVVRLKAEDQTDPNISVETEATSTMAGWDTLIFDFANEVSGTSPINFANTYDLLSIFYDFGNAGAADTFYLDDVYFGSGIGLIEMGWSQIEIAPNPTNGLIRLTGQLGTDTDHQIMVTDIRGRVLINLDRRNNQLMEQLDLSRFNNGTYLISIIGESGMITKKVVLQR